MYVFGNHIYHKQIVCLVYMLQNDLNNENHLISKIRVRFKVEKSSRWSFLKVDGDAEVNGLASS